MEVEFSVRQKMKSAGPNEISPGKSQEAFLFSNRNFPLLTMYNVRCMDRRAAISTAQLLKAKE